MKKLIYLLPLLLVACVNTPQSKQYQLKYKQGDVVYLKPDSTKVVIDRIELGVNDADYVGHFNDKNGDHVVFWFQEYEIY
jgi:hypothetical protein